jgi:hypothetical protein
MELVETGAIVNRVSSAHGVFPQWDGLSISAPESRELAALDLAGVPAVRLPDESPLRAALQPLVEKLMATRQVEE